MNRLLDETSPADPATARAVELLRAAPRLERADERLERVAERIRAVNAASPPRRFPLRRAVRVAAAVAGLALLAYLALRPRPGPHSPPRPAPSSAAAIEPGPARAEPAPVEAPAAAPLQEAPSDGPVMLDPSPAPTLAPIHETPAPAPSRLRRPGRAPRASGTSIADLEGEAALVRKATQALHGGEGGPPRAVELLRGYRRKYPRGALTDEALYLSAEAGVLTSDPHAARFAREYLRRFPEGRFRRRMEQLLAQPSR